MAMPLARTRATNRVRAMLSLLGAVRSHHMSARARPSSYRLTIPVILLAVCFSAVCGWILVESRRATGARATEAATSLVGSLKSDIARNVEILNLSLQGAAKNLKLPDLDRLSPEMRQQVLFDHSSTGRYLTSTLVVDETGRTTFDSRSLSPSQRPVSDRDYFQVHKD